MVNLPGLILHIKELLIGFCLGTANIIPGVSGGTFLLIFKIYERVFCILANITKSNVIYFFKQLFKIAFSSDRSRNLIHLRDFLIDNDFIFFIKLLVGSVVAILSLSSLMKYLIVHHFSSTYALFFGLILVSIIIPVRMLKTRKIYLVFFIVAGAVLTIYVTWAVNPYDKIEKKSALYQMEYSDLQNAGEKPVFHSAVNSSGSHYAFGDYFYATICGAVSVSAMVLPGISGSLVLILMGEYFEVVSAISGLLALKLENFIFLGCFSIGIIFGGLFFAKFIAAVLKKYYNATMAFLTGLMAGSLYALWPFKKSIVLAQQYVKIDGNIKMLENTRVYTNINELPAMNSEFYFPVLFFFMGCIIMAFFLKKELDS